MIKLMKYEFRKTGFSKLLLLGITAVFEIVFLAGIFLKKDNPLFIGITSLMMCAVIGIFYIGIESMISLHRDLNTKQSYMLFLTPKNSYQILGAKVLENGLSIFAAGVFFSALAAIDASIALLYVGGLKELIDMINQMLEQFSISISGNGLEILLAFFSVLVNWIQTVVTGFLAIILSATVFAGKKISGYASFLIFLAMSWVTAKIASVPLELLPDKTIPEVKMAVCMGIMLAIAAVIYLICGWIMEKKLSV